MIILPACRTIRLSNLRKINTFLQNGGIVLATSFLPEQSAEFGRDADVRALSRRMFGEGRKGIFVQTPSPGTLKEAFACLPMVWDVTFENATEISGDGSSFSYTDGDNGTVFFSDSNREFSYIHRSATNREIYFFANSSTTDVEADIVLRGHVDLERRDPHSGMTEAVPFEHGIVRGEAVTRFTLQLAAINSVFIIGT